MISPNDVRVVAGIDTNYRVMLGVKVVWETDDSSAALAFCRALREALRGAFHHGS